MGLFLSSARMSAAGDVAPLNLAIERRWSFAYSLGGVFFWVSM